MDEQTKPDFRLHITASLSDNEITQRRELLKARCDTAGVDDGVLDTIMIGAMMAQGLLDCGFRRHTEETLEIMLAAQQAPEGADPA